MGFVYENITLKNATDVVICNRGDIQEGEVRQIKVLAMVDTGAETLIINEEMQKDLGLYAQGEKPVALADKSAQMCIVTEPVMIYWKERSAVTRAVVLPGLDEVLLGAIPLEEMDVMVDPTRQQLVGIHGDQVICRV